jgi:hypothetical protein
MQLTQKHRDSFVMWFCILFYLLMIYKWINGLFLYQLEPHIFNTRFDFVTWLLMNSGLHKWLIDNPNGWLAFDLTFYLSPLLYWLLYKTNQKGSFIFAGIMLVINFTYLQCYTLYPANSIESFTAWLLFPLLLMTTSISSFYFVLNGLRYFFLFVLSSAAIWKFVQMGIFNSKEMSGVLLYQHKEYLVSSPNSFYTTLIYWLINHSTFSFSLYAIATGLELIFLVGFFTKEIDNYLILLFLLFIVMDLLIMRIPYLEISPFILTLIYSRYQNPSLIDWK